MNELLKVCRTNLVTEIKRQYESGTFTTLSLNTDFIFSSFKDLYQKKFSLIPDFFTPEANYKFIDELKKSDFIKISHARENFDKGFYDTLTSSSQIKKALDDFLSSLEEHKEEMTYYALISPIAVETAFIVGTVYQIVYDFFNTIVSLLSYAGQALYYVGNKAYKAATGTTDAIQVNVSVLRQLIPDIDLETFFTEDIPNFIDEVIAFAIKLVNDYADNAKEWGKNTAEYIIQVAGNSFNTAYSLFFDPMNPNDSAAGKIWWAFKQWFYMGTLFGPLIVDVVLFFCSGSVSGYFSAANKIGKLGKLEDIFKTFKYFSELKKLSIIKTISSKWNESEALVKLVQKIYGSLIDLSLGAADKLKTIITDAYKLMANVDELPGVDEVMTKIDEIYDKAQNLDFFLSICLLLLGGEFDKQGELTI